MTELDLDFAGLRRIEEIMPAVELDNLVAVFSTKEEVRLLLVYNSQTMPAVPLPHKAIPLEELADVPLPEYDGLLLAFAALDVIRTDLVTKGPKFYPLERILLKLSQPNQFSQTMLNLAAYLVRFLEDLREPSPLRRQRTVSKILQLALPALLRGRPANGLVAALPGRDLAAFVRGRTGLWLGLGDDWRPLARRKEDEWLIAFAEVAGPAAQTGRFVELRELLRRAGYQDVLRQTIQGLAGYYATSSRRPQRQVAWSLAAESHLMVEDTEDLVALLPHGDFEQFWQTGVGLRVYRTLHETSRSGPAGLQWPLPALAERSIPAPFRRLAFSLLTADLLPGLEDKEASNLARLLWEVGHSETLARTSLLTARDALNGTPAAAALPLEWLIQMIWRAIWIISLGDPWFWRGRQWQLLEEAYGWLRVALQRQVFSLHDEALGHFYSALSYWYDPAYAGQEEKLRTMASHLRTFLRGWNQETGALAPFVEDARRLIRFEEDVLYTRSQAHTREGESSLAEEAPLPDLEMIWDIKLRPVGQLPFLTPLFQRTWEQLRQIRWRRQQAQSHEPNPDMQQVTLANLLMLTMQQRELALVPPHEKVALGYLFDREQSLLEERLGEVENQVQLQILPVSPYLEYQKEVRLTFEIHNEGRRTAHNVELVLTPDSSFELLEHSFVREIPELPPGEPHRLTYLVRANKLPSALFNFTYSYQGIQANMEALLQLPVRSLDEKPFKRKKDPYKFGRAIQNPADFYGREKEIGEILSFLAHGSYANFLLRGPRRMGKTSLLYMIHHALREPAVRRRFSIPAEWDASLDVYRPIMLDLQAFELGELQNHTRHFFYALLDTVARALADEQREELLANFDKRQREIDVPRATLEQLNLIFESQPQARAVVLLDEYDELYHPAGRSLDTALRHVVQSEQRLTWIIASTQFLFKEGKSYGSPWFNILHIIELERLSNEAAQHLIEEPIQGEDVLWHSDAVVNLLDATGRHPAFVQLFCSKIIHYLNSGRKNYVLPETILELADQIVVERETAHNHFEFYWKDISGVGRLILLAADEAERPPTRLALRNWVMEQLEQRFAGRVEQLVADVTGNLISWREREYESGMAWVSQVVNALTFDKASRTYTFTVPLFRRWLQHRGRHENLLETALALAEAELKRDEL